MLSELSIENFAIIDRLRVRFSAGLTVMTGETGAGKSIIIDALQAALGARTGSEVIRSEAALAAVEAVFDWPEEGDADGLATLLSEYGIESEECLILRREISPTGRGSARINGRAVPLSALSAAGSVLVDIHGQSDHLSILRRDRQLAVLDRYGELRQLRSQVADAIKEYTALRRSLEELAAGRREAEQRLDLLRFQVQEIESAQLQPDEEEELATERNLLVNAEKLAKFSRLAFEALQGESGAVLEGMHSSLAALKELIAIDPSGEGLASRLETAQYELEDIGQELRQYRDRMEYDPQRLDALSERLDLLTRLKRKYGSTVGEVIAFGAVARTEMEGVENLDERLSAVAEQATEAETLAGGLAQELSLGRRRAAEALSAAMELVLQDLGLGGTNFEVEVAQTPAAEGLPLPSSKERFAYSQSGIDTVGFLVSFNPGEPLRPLDKVASGGETSRFLLALKSVLAEADQTPTLIFDEIDVGVGARAGMEVGERLRHLSADHQVVSITHLPQIAALADEHLTVAKVVSGGRASVAVSALEHRDRIAEIAEMMSGSGTEAARRSAQELLEAAKRSQ